MPRGPHSSAPQPPPATGTGSRWSARNWRVPTRLNAILLIPVLVALVFGGFKVESDVSAWQDAKEAQRTAELVEAAANYGNALIDERDRTAEPLLKGEKDDPAVRKARAATDRAAKEFKAAVSHLPDNPGLKRRLAAFEKVEPRLPVLRETAYTKDMNGVETEEGYVTIQHPLMEFANELGLGTGNVTSYGRTVYAISLAKAAVSLQRSLGTHLMVEPGPTRNDKEAQLTALASYHYLERIALGEYTSGGRSEDVQLLKEETAKAKEAGRKRIEAAKEHAAAKGEKFVEPPSMDKMVKAIGSGAGPGKLRAKGITTESYFATATGTFDAYRAIEQELVDNSVAETKQIASDAQRNALVNSAIVLVALLLAFVIAGRMARSMSQSMRSLRTAAFDVAQQRLPMLVDQLSRTEPGRVDTRVQPIPITSRDEIGEVARAFDQVHREAVRLAAEQALLRGNVNAIFTNLSRRNQGLIERQLELVTEMENSEADPDQLEKLFRMDHLSTRMRRNGENLLVLAGEEPGRRWTEPVPLVDILRAASSEVEHYERIEISGIPETEIHGQVVNDLVHLLAELLENAASFSSPQSKVRVTATRLPDGRMMIEIHDKGIGLTAEDFADINHKLANPPTVDAAVSQRMGLFVVGRLADRHGIRVQLRPSGEQAGTTSLVMLPDAITHGGGGEESPEEDFTVSRIVPEQPREHDALDSRSAAELGFDDSRYGVGDQQSPPLGSISRSRFREERRAALEAPQSPLQQPHPAQQQPQQQEQDRQQAPQAGQPQSAPDQRQDVYGQGQPYDPGQGQQPYDAYGPGDRYQQQRDPYQQGYEGYEGYEQTGEIAAQQYTGGYQPQQFQPQQPGHEGRYGPQQPQAESAPGVPQGEAERVGFDRPDSLPTSYGATTDAGLPRRDMGRQQQDGGPEAQHQGSAQGWEAPVTPGWEAPAEEAAGQPSQEETGTHRWSENDERWTRAGQLRAPQSGGVTSSGLPRRVPRANLVAGAAEESSQGGPSVSRAPEDVRGRLSNLHRGVRQGRTAGDGNQNDRQGFGPGSTYDQER
ncbi:nitrate- and nitrite sensing domain-containing protein [Streptomyces smyrnaeus]|uniref:histidine kinase n=1 Tax=Streptomyces smyrnaeus TaxID=1387713 RepID=A0ABS3Y794_9ACTN|nr:nitrate- and nitrite sensing domain-containing protein [Streptomyces smyrnaeus]MBO8203519.1 nitrate- and nitrite sensing domain-containing protein [Streptomyces smyrnaeus]